MSPASVFLVYEEFVSKTQSPLKVLYAKISHLCRIYGEHVRAWSRSLDSQSLQNITMREKIEKLHESTKYK